MADVANDEKLPIETRFNAAREVAKYVAHQLRAIEVTGEDGGPVKHEVLNVALPPRVESLADWRARVTEVYGSYAGDQGEGTATGADDGLQGQEGQG